MKNRPAQNAEPHEKIVKPKFYALTKCLKPATLEYDHNPC